MALSPLGLEELRLHLPPTEPMWCGINNPKGHMETAACWTCVMTRLSGGQHAATAQLLWFQQQPLTAMTSDGSEAFDTRRSSRNIISEDMWLCKLFMMQSFHQWLLLGLFSFHFTLIPRSQYNLDFCVFVKQLLRDNLDLMYNNINISSADVEIYDAPHCCQSDIVVPCFLAPPSVWNQGVLK